MTIWTKDVDKINLLFELLNSLDENLKFTVEICGKSLWMLDWKITIEEEKVAKIF